MRFKTLNGCATALLLAALAALTACTSVHVSGAQPIVSQGFGIAAVRLQPDRTAPVVITTRGAGVIATASGFTIGLVNETVATFPDASACRTLIIVQDPSQFDALHRVLAEDPARLGSLCLATKSTETNEEREK